MKPCGFFPLKLMLGGTKALGVPFQNILSDGIIHFVFQVSMAMRTLGRVGVQVAWYMSTKC